MSSLLKSRYYLMKCFLFVLLFGFISLGTIGGCNNNGDGNNTQALTENDFATTTSLRANPLGGVIAMFLEHPESEAPPNDTAEIGRDTIPIRYKSTLEHTFCWEDDDEEAEHFMELADEQSNEVLRVDVNGECVTEIIEAGDYIMTIHHDGRLETTHPIFIIPNPEDLEQARETDGLINRFKVVAANILKQVQKTVTKDAEAQSVQDNINTLLKTNSCVFCDLMQASLIGADLLRANLNEANLTKANLSLAILTEANLSFAALAGATLKGADLTEANLDQAGMTDANLINALLDEAILTGAGLVGANLTGASLTGANLTSANLGQANLSNANLSESNLSDAELLRANLSGANLIGANLTGADLTEATWCNGCKCSDAMQAPSIGTCTDCPSVEEACNVQE